MSWPRVFLLVAASAALLLAAQLCGRAWLGALFFWSGVPVGSIGFVLVMGLLDGRWRVLMPAMVRGSTALPVGAVAIVPVLFALGAFYPWVAHPAEGFRGVWLSPAFFVARTAVWFAGLAAIVVALFRRGPDTAVVATIGLLFLFAVGSFVAVDWLMSLDPAFHSSGFGLQALEVQFTVALMVAVLRAPPDPSGITGALMLTLLMLWGYFAYLPFFIIWSGDAPAGAHWYLARGSGGWGAVCTLAALPHAAGVLALLSSTVRRSAGALRIIALAVLAGDALQAAWLAMPGSGPLTFAGAGLYLLALLVIGVPTLLAGRQR